MTDHDAEKLARDCVASMFSRDTAAREAGIRIVDVSPGSARLEMPVREDMLNGHNVCHGGYIFLLADSAFAYACNNYNRVNVAQNCDIDFLRPGRLGDVMVATATERRQGRLTGLYDVTVETSQGSVLAVFRGRSFQLDGEVILERKNVLLEK